MFGNAFGISPFQMSPFGGNNMMGGGLAALGMGLGIGMMMGRSMGDGANLSQEACQEGGGQQGQQQEMMMLLMLLMMMMQGQGQSPFGSPFGGSPFGGSPFGGSPFMGGGGSPFMPGGMPGGFPGFSPMGGYNGGGYNGGGYNGAPSYCGPATGNPSQAVSIAQQHLGQASNSFTMPNYSHAGGVTNDCADFASGCIANAGTFHKTAGDANVGQFQRDLQSQGWHQVSQQQAQPGDVAIVNGSQHAEVVAGPGGRCIGSNGGSSQHIGYDTPSNWGSVVYWAPPGH